MAGFDLDRVEYPERVCERPAVAAIAEPSPTAVLAVAAAATLVVPAAVETETEEWCDNFLRLLAADADAVDADAVGEAAG